MNISDDDRFYEYYYQSYEPETKSEKDEAFDEFLRNIEATRTENASRWAIATADLLGSEDGLKKLHPWMLSFDEKKALFEDLWTTRLENEDADRSMQEWNTQTARQMNERNRHNQIESERGLWEGSHPLVRDNRWDMAFGFRHDPIPVSFGESKSLPEPEDEIQFYEPVRDDETQPYLPDDEQMLAEIDRAAEECRWDDYNELVKEYCRL